MRLGTAIAFARRQKRCVLITLKRDGRPQSSNVLYVVDDDEFLVSLTDDRAKTRNLRRDPRVSLHVSSADLWSYVVLEGEAELTPAALDPSDATVDALVSYYRKGSGEHPEWDEFRQAMVSERRLLLRVRPTYAYGLIRE
ncbi:MAG: PPOX class F420-dependent oxidoreductase [Candidatus Nanopelagicales bacterium]